MGTQYSQISQTVGRIESISTLKFYPDVGDFFTMSVNSKFAVWDGEVENLEFSETSENIVLRFISGWRLFQKQTKMK